MNTLRYSSSEWHRFFPSKQRPIQRPQVLSGGGGVWCGVGGCKSDKAAGLNRDDRCYLSRYPPQNAQPPGERQVPGERSGAGEARGGRWPGRAGLASPGWGEWEPGGRSLFPSERQRRRRGSLCPPLPPRGGRPGPGAGGPCSTIPAEPGPGAALADQV